MPHYQWKPAVDVLRGPAHWLLKVELAGASADLLDISAEDKTLIIRGKRSDTFRLKGYVYQQLEINYDVFERRISFPFNIDTRDLPCQYQDGILLIMVRSNTRQD